MKNLILIIAMFLGVGACTVPLKPILCGSDSTMIFPKGEIVFRFGTQQTTPCAKRKVRVRLEISNLNYIYWRDTAKCRAHFRNIFNQVKAIYANDPANINLELEQIKIWTTADPYTVYPTGSTVLYNYAVTEFAKPENSQYDLAVYVDRNNGANNKTNFGYLNGLNPGYYAQKYAYVCLPIKEPVAHYPNYDYNVKTIAHELGHNFGARHSQWCGHVRQDGTIGPLDSCSQPEAVSGQPACRITRKPNKTGSIMSYCDLDINGGVDFTKGFGFPAIRNVMVQTLASCTSCPCDVSLPPPLPCTYTYSNWSDCQPNGTQTRTVVSQSPNGCTGTPVLSQSCTYVPPVTQDGVIGPVMHYTQNATSFFRFGIPITGDWRYEVAYCRYDGTMNPPDSATPPATCGIRNALNFSSPTSAQLSAGQINLQAISQPYERNKWYRVRVRYRNGASGAILVKQSAWFWW